MYVSCVLGDKLRITMSSIMRWRRREIGLVIDGLLSTGLHERAILADRRLPTDDQNPIEMTDGPTGDYSKSDKALSKPSKSTFSIWVSDLDPGDYRGSGLVQRNVMERLGLNHSGLMPADFTTLAHFSVSAAT